MSFGFASTTKAGFSGFGTTSSTTTAKVQPFSFGGNTANTTASTGTTSAFNFGAATSQAAKTTASLFGTTTTNSTGFSGFGSGAGFKLGGTATTTAATSGLSFGSGLFGGTSASSSAPTLGSTLTTTSATQFKGLGGVTSTSSTSNQNDNGNKGSGVSQALKEENVPAELCKDVKDFEEFVKRQKEGSNTVGKFSVRSLRKIQEEVATLSYSLGTVSSALHRNNAAVQKLRADFTEELRNIEIARHTLDIPPALQHDNIAPIKFFMNMVIDFEASMQVYRKQIEELENHLNLTDQPAGLTPQDIYVALCKMQESFVSLAANLHSVHQQVKNLKENYLIYRRIVHSDPTNVFELNRQASNRGKPPKSAGISPFNQLSNVAALAMATMTSQQNQQQGPPQQGFLSTQPAGGSGLFGAATKPTGTASLFGGNTGGSKLGFSGFGTTTKPLSAGIGTSSGSLFGDSSSLNPSAGLTFGGPAAGGTFELKRPPLGNKRWKK